ncbi:Endothelin-converting enzyme 1 [Bulinus truncatus]|nr:Endothelin-converting enzyme 1 [Bulinus truncatus]
MFWCLAFVVSLCVTVVSGFTVRDEAPSGQQVCLTDGCKKTSQFILSYLDPTVDPCVDMYKFACGGWTRENDIPAGYSKWSSVEEMAERIKRHLIELVEEDGWVFKGKNSTTVKKFKQLYKSCKDVQAIEGKGAQPIKELIDQYGSWTVTKTNKTWNRKTWRLQEALQNSHSLMGSSFFGLSIDKDPKNASRNILSIHQSGITFKDYVSEYDNPGVRGYYIEIAMTVGRLLGGRNRTVMTKMAQVFNLEKSLTKIFIPKEEMTNPNKLYNLMTLRQFQKLIGSWIDMQKYMDAIFGKGVVTSDDLINVATPSYFKQLKTVINSYDREVLANYIIWNLLLPTMGYLPKGFSVADVFATKPAEKIIDLDPRQEKCLEKSKKLMPFVTSALYVDRHFSQETVVKVATALDDIEHEFISNMNQLTWLDDETKRNLKEKAQAMTNQVGYPDWILDPSILDAEYEDLEIEEGEYFRNFIHSIKFHTNIEKRKLRQPPLRNVWLIAPDTVNAYYNMQENEVVVLAGILQEPIISKDYPTPYLYGTLGAILAHEIVHAFDSSGRLFDKDGNMKDNWTPHVAEEFDKRAQCLIDQYNTFEVYGQNISGLLTLGENIADNGGIKMAYRAYKSAIKSHDLSLPGLNLTDDQLYFLGLSHFYCAEYTKDYAISSIRNDDHAHNQFRVIGTVSNSKEFSAAFNCPLKSPMNPEKKCEVW